MEFRRVLFRSASFSRPILAPRIYLIPNTWPSWPRRSKRLTATPRQENDSDRITRRARSEERVSGKSVSVRVDLGGLRLIKKNTREETTSTVEIQYQSCRLTRTTNINRPI